MNRIASFLSAGFIGASVIAAGFMARPAFVRADDRTGGPKAVAMIQGAGEMKDKITGTVIFTSETDGVRVVASVDGLTPGDHGFHIHEKPDLTADDLSSAGPHFNPDGHKHGGPEAEEHHAGDLGNLTADDKGHAHYDMVIKGLTIDGKTGVVGHSVIIHAKADDLKSQPAGESGKRVAGGAIVAKTNARQEK